MNTFRPRTTLFKGSFIAFCLVILLLLLLALFHQPLLRKIGGWVVVDDGFDLAEAVVVLNSGVEYYPRLIEAASLYNKGLVKEIIINGDRKTDEIRELESMGYQPCCPWYENSFRVLKVFGVPGDKIIHISLEDAYDTVSEAKGVGEEILRRGISRIIITTSKYHTRRARFIWQKMYHESLDITMAAARQDPYDPDKWWKDGRQIRWLMAEYGAWIYLAWKNIQE